MGKRKTVKQQIAAALIFSLCMLFLTACGGQKLSDSFDEAALRSGVEEVIQSIADKESDKLRDMCNVRMKEALTDDVLSQIYEAIGEGGAFREITDFSAAGTKDKQTEEEFAVVVAKAKYENRNFIYTITFTKQMKLAGLYYK
jgi:hypothetical protein